MEAYQETSASCACNIAVSKVAPPNHQSVFTTVPLIMGFSGRGKGMLGCEDPTSFPAHTAAQPGRALCSSL